MKPLYLLDVINTNIGRDVVVYLYPEEHLDYVKEEKAKDDWIVLKVKRSLDEKDR